MINSNNYTSIDLLKSLYTLFDRLNEKYFDNVLPKPYITLYAGKKAKNSTCGLFYTDVIAKTYYDEEKNETVVAGGTEVEVDNIYEIGIAFDMFDRPFDDIAATLLHEMIHYYCALNHIKDTNKTGTKHNKKFKAQAEKRDLCVNEIEHEKCGYELTSPSPAFSIWLHQNCFDIDRKPFSYIRQTTVPEPTVAKRKAWICPICGEKISASEETNIICGDCQKPFDFWDITDSTDPILLIDRNDGLSQTGQGWYYNEFLLGVSE